jgi:Fe-S-cluster containining protein
LEQIDAESKAQQDLETIKGMVALKRQKLGVKYNLFTAKVAEVLRANYPGFTAMPDEQMNDLVASVDVMGEESRGLMKKLGEFCAGCGWCCSQTSKIVVTKADVEHISRALKLKAEDVFKSDGKEWTIKQGHPCQWWNSRNGRCTIYNIRPSVCRTWPLAINEKGQKLLHSNAECAYAVLVLADKVMRHLRSAAASS